MGECKRISRPASSEFPTRTLAAHGRRISDDLARHSKHQGLDRPQIGSGNVTQFSGRIEVVYGCPCRTNCIRTRRREKERVWLIGVKSSARKLGERTRPFLYGVYALMTALTGLAGAIAGLGNIFFAGLALAFAHLMWQAWRVDTEDPEDCLAKFRSNKWLGWIVFRSIVAGSVTS